MKKTALFIDGSNAHATAKLLGIDIDYSEVLKYYGNNLLRAYYYTAVLDDKESYSSIQPLIDWLTYNGYTVVTKPTKSYTDPLTGMTKIKGNMDCEITTDALTLGHNGSIDRAVFFTGDGDFRPMVLELQRSGVHVTVVSSIVSKPNMCSDELRRAADVFVDISTLADKFNRPKTADRMERSERRSSRFG